MTVQANTTNTKEHTFTKAEKRAFSHTENRIFKNIRNFVQLGEDLLKVKEKNLQAIKGYTPDKKGFDLYCSDTFDISSIYVYKMIKAYQVMNVLEAFSTVPNTESQCRPLSVLLDKPEELTALWAGLVEKYTQGLIKLTAACIQMAVNKHINKDSEQTDKTKNSEQTNNSKQNKENKGSDNSDDSEQTDDSAQTNDSEQTDAKTESKKDLEIKELKRKLMEAELQNAKLRREAHRREAFSGNIPTSSMAKRLFKAGFRKLAAECHSDTGGNDELMKELLELKAELGI